MLAVNSIAQIGDQNSAVCLMKDLTNLLISKPNEVYAVDVSYATQLLQSLGREAGRQP